jgi:hypothetical protein
MATDKPRFTITLDPGVFTQVQEFKKRNKLSTQSKAIQKLVEIGLSDVLSENASPLSADEAALLDDYRSLSSSGKEYIRQTMALALRSYTGKDDIVPDVEGVV